jgi:hypothetical protein
VSPSHMIVTRHLMSKFERDYVAFFFKKKNIIPNDLFFTI